MDVRLMEVTKQIFVLNKQYILSVIGVISGNVITYLPFLESGVKILVGVVTIFVGVLTCVKLYLEIKNKMKDGTNSK